jgi:hypothetical protein
MKKLLSILAFCFVFSNAFSQAVTEKLIVKLLPEDVSTGYDVKYDKNTGGFVYQHYDTTTSLAYMITPKGKTGNYGGVNSYNAFFDKQGNVYFAAFNVKEDTVYTYFLLKNTDVIGTFEFINDNWIEKNGSLYFSVKENGKTSLAALDLSGGTITKGNAYDDIMFVYYPVPAYEGEPIGYPGFTSDGKPYYIASENAKKFVVIGDQKQKEYADIDAYNFTLDKNGQLVYIANDKGSLYDDSSLGATFVVQGNKEYKKFDYVYGPLIFDNNNNPVYTAGYKSNNTSIYPQKIVIGDNETGKKYTSGVSFQQFMPSGQLVFVGSTYIDSAHSSSCLVIDGKEGKKYDNIANLIFTQNNVPVFVATDGSKQFVVKGDSKLTDGYPGIMDFKMLPGSKLCFTSAVWGNYDKGIPDKYYVHIGDEKFGPYEAVSISAYGDGVYVQTDNAGNYGYIASKIIDMKNYVYQYTAYSNRGKSAAFDNIDNMKLLNGKLYFAGSKVTDRTNYASRTKLYCDFKPITEEYDSFTSLDAGAPQPGIMAFTGSKGNEIYYIEVKY